MVAIAADVAVCEPDRGFVVEVNLPERGQPDHFPQEIEVFRFVLRLKRAQPFGAYQVVAVQRGTRTSDANHGPLRMLAQERLPVLHIAGEYGHPQAEFHCPRAEVTHLLPVESLAREFPFARLQGDADIREPLAPDSRHVLAGIAHLLDVQKGRTADCSFHSISSQHRSG